MQRHFGIPDHAGRVGGRIAFVLSGLLLTAPIAAQDSAAEHAAHHPAGSPSGTSSQPAPQAAPTLPSPSAPPPAAGSMGQMMGSMMGGMMASAAASDEKAAGCCGMGGPTPFYASLMEWPKLTDEARRAVTPKARERLNSGMVALSTQQNQIHRALAANDFTSAADAIARARESLALAESGAGVLNGLAQGQAPRDLAMRWFKHETAVGEDHRMGVEAEIAGLSWWHAIAMAGLVAAVIAALISWRSRRRRVSELVSRLTAGVSTPSTLSSLPTGAALRGSATVQGAPVQRPWKGALRIKAIFMETSTVKTFRLMEANDGPIPFGFLPGQYATITSEIDGQKVRRSYTISSSPTQRDYIELTIKREQHGLESRHMHDHALPGDLVEISAPAGRFFFTGKEAEGIVLIAGGVGITPMMSVLRSLTDRSYPHDIYLLYGVNTPHDVIFGQECAYLSQRHPRLHISTVVAKPEGTDWSGPTGYISAEIIAATVPEIAGRRIHLCGPPPMMEAVKAALSQLGVPTDQVKTEDFAPPKGGPVASFEPPTESRELGGPVSPSVAAQSASIPTAHASISFAMSNKAGPLAPDQSVLEAAEALGVSIDFDCREGTCGRCKVHLREGQVVMEVEDALSREEKASSIILACQAKSTGNLIVDA